MENKYIYKNEDITLDILMKIENVVHLISEKEHKTFDECYIDFAGYATYRALQNTETLMWGESAEFIVDEYFLEIRT